MQFVTLSENCTKVRRNLLVLSTAAIFIKYFNIQITNASALGMQFQGLTTESIEILLFILITYKLISFSWVAIDETRHWIITSNLFRRGEAFDSCVNVFSREFEKFTDLHKREQLYTHDKNYLEKKERSLELITKGLKEIQSKLRKVLLPFKIRVILWEVSLPIIIGVCAILMLLHIVNITFI
jgi:hypothetical protein